MMTIKLLNQNASMKSAQCSREKSVQTLRWIFMYSVSVCVNVFFFTFFFWIFLSTWCHRTFEFYDYMLEIFFFIFLFSTLVWFLDLVKKLTKKKILLGALIKKFNCSVVVVVVVLLFLALFFKYKFEMYIK